MDAELRYQPDTDQVALAEGFGEALADILPIARLHQAPAETDDIWTQLAELGLFGIGVAEDQGGSGLGVIEEALIVTELGRQLVSPSIIATLGAAHLPGHDPMANRRVAAAWRRDGRIVGVDLDGAELVLLREADGASLHAIEGMGPPIESQLWLAPLVEVRPGAEIGRSDAAGLLRLRLIDAAALAGIARMTLDMAVAYAQVREQFGRPIGSFQAVKHHCANMAIAARGARDQVSFAAVAIADGRADAALQVDSAVLVAAKAAIGNAGLNIQVHGGIGFSDEADPHLAIKRAQLLTTIAGGIEQATDRIAGLPFSF